VRDDKDRLIAKALGTFKYLKRRVLAEGSAAKLETNA
jgi:hypothetical protein